MRNGGAVGVRFEGPMKNFRNRLTGMLLWTMIVSSCSWGDRPVEEPIESDPGKFAPLTLKTLNGETRSVSHFMGKVTLVNFFFPT